MFNTHMVRGGFGGNNGRQGAFDANDPLQRRSARDRKAQLEMEWGDRLTPNFTGSTGLASNDAHGFSRMLNAQTEYQNILRGMKGHGPMDVEWGGVMPSEPTPTTVWDAEQVPASVKGMYNTSGYDAGDLFGVEGQDAKGRKVQTRRMPENMRRLRPRGNAEEL